MKLKNIFARLLHKCGKNLQAARLLGVKFGDGCKFIGDPVSTFGSEPWAITLGNSVEITNGTQFITHDGALWTLRNREAFSNADLILPIRVGDNVFIGVGSVILPGVTIGSNVVIGAGSVVTKDIPSGSVAVGAPARVIESLDCYAEKMKTRNLKSTKGLSSHAKRAIWDKELKK